MCAVILAKSCFNPNQPGPSVCIYDTNVGAHMEGWGCSIFIETNVKRQSNSLPFKACSIQKCTEHIQPSPIISKYDSKRCGTTARVIRGHKFDVQTLLIITINVINAKFDYAKQHL